MEVGSRMSWVRKKVRTLNGRKYILKGIISLKYFMDCFSLPLSREHKALYFVIHQYMHEQLNRFPNLVSGDGLNDKIQWLKLFDQQALIIQCSDKLQVRDYIISTIGVGFLPEIYQICDEFQDIDIEKLPDYFVMKSSHDSGSTLIVKDKSELDKKAAEVFFTSSLKSVYGTDNGEWAYFFIRPRVFAEELLGPRYETSPPADYKFHCSNGKVLWHQLICDRGANAKEVITDSTGEILSIHLNETFSFSKEFSKPEQWGDLINVAEKLSAPFKYVRVDLYLVKERVYVGELTFFPWKGCHSGEGENFLGKMLVLDRSTPCNLYCENI